MSDCPRLGRFGGCRFEPRYDTGAPTLSTEQIAAIVSGQYSDDLAVSELMHMIEVSSPSTYVHDVCIRCGKKVERTNRV